MPQNSHMILCGVLLYYLPRKETIKTHLKIQGGVKILICYRKILHQNISFNIVSVRMEVVRIVDKSKIDDKTWMWKQKRDLPPQKQVKLD